MKVFISDIHLTDGTTGAHNIGREDGEFFWEDIQMEGLKPEDVEVVILGDFIDLIRSTRWKEVQPWHGPQAIRSTVVEIVESIIHLNREFLGFLRGLTEKGVRITYILGNHDRLMNEVDGVRGLLREALGLEGEDSPFPHHFYSENLSLYATHGNEADVYNRSSHGEAPIGDAIVTLLINPFPEHPFLKDLPDFERIRKSLQEIDNLRPTTVAPLWIEHCVKGFGREEKERVKEAWKDLVRRFYEDPFVKEWFDEYDVWYNPVDKADQLQIAFEYFTESSMQRLMEKILEIRNDFYRPKDEYIRKAGEYMEEKGCRYVLFGHTHEPRIHLVDEAGGGRFYINTGTWRRRIVMGEPRKRVVPFAPLKTISYALFYEGWERERTGRDFEVWDGSVGM